MKFYFCNIANRTDKSVSQQTTVYDDGVFTTDKHRSRYSWTVERPARESNPVYVVSQTFCNFKKTNTFHLTEANYKKNECNIKKKKKTLLDNVIQALLIRG